MCGSNYELSILVIGILFFLAACFLLNKAETLFKEITIMQNDSKQQFNGVKNVFSNTDVPVHDDNEMYVDSCETEREEILNPTMTTREKAEIIIIGLLVISFYTAIIVGACYLHVSFK